MKIMQDVYGQWHNTAIVGSIYVTRHGVDHHRVVFETVNHPDITHTLEIPRETGEEGRESAIAYLNLIVWFLAHDNKVIRESDTFPFWEAARREESDREARLRKAQAPV